MKKAVLAALLLVVQMGFAQDFKTDPDTKLITYSEVMEVQGVSKSDLYLRANTWLARAFKSAKSVIDFQDKEAGKIIGKGRIGTLIKMPLSPKVESGDISITITLFCKDGKYKYVIDNLEHNAPNTTGTGTWASVGPLEKEKPKVGMLIRPSGMEWTALKIDADKSIKSLIEDMKKAMSKADGDF
jgi:hypothetical protein